MPDLQTTIIAVLLFGAVLSQPQHRRPAFCVMAAFLLLLAEPSRGPEGQRLAGACTALAMLTFACVTFVVVHDFWKRYLA
jgi:hypothetical protein